MVEENNEEHQKVENYPKRRLLTKQQFPPCSAKKTEAQEPEVTRTLPPEIHGKYPTPIHTLRMHSNRQDNAATESRTKKHDKTHVTNYAATRLKHIHFP